MARLVGPRTLDSLEWDLLKQEWKKRCSTAAGVEAVDSLATFPGWDEAHRRLEAIEEIRTLKAQGHSLYVEDVPELEDMVSVLEKGGYLKAKDLARLIHFQRNVRDIVRILDEQTPALSFLFGALDPLAYLTSLLEGAIDDEGNVRSEASPKLFGLRKRFQELRKEIIARLESMMQSASVAPYLQDDFYTIREERYVLPVKSEFRSEVPGMIHGVSSSGQTVYIEPHALVELNNRIREIRLDIELEELKVLSDLGDAVSDELAAIKRNMKLMAFLDALVAASRLANDLSLQPWAFGEELELRAARHPILLAMGMEVVPNDVELKKGRVLVVTGPNAGGKTVLLKTIGSVVLMASVGLPVPATKARIPRYGAVHAIIGDPQDITEHKSTFSGHVEWLRDVLSEVDRDDLVLIDELASGTDPAQGAALGQAVLEYLAQKGTTVVATTHYGVLKALALTDERFLNASIGGSGLRPDYKLVMGVPGVSSGLDLARRIGLPEEVVQRAEEIFRSGDQGLDELFLRLREKEKELDQLRSELENRLRELESERQALAREREDLERRRREIIREKRDAVMEELDRLRNMVAVLEERASTRRGRKADPQRLRDGVEKVAARLKEVEKVITSEPVIRVGERVYSLSLGREVEIVEVKGNRVKVRAGALFIDVKRDDLRAPGDLGTTEEKKPGSRGKGRKAKGGAPSSSSETTVHVMKPSTTLDLRGRRVDEAIDELERFVDRMMLKGESSFAVIHGYGSGALMKAVRKYLKESPYVASFRPGEPGEGGDGVTVAFLV